MKKKILLFSAMFFLFSLSVSAGSSNVSISSNKTKVVEGETVKFTVKVNGSGSNMAFCTFDVSSTNLTFVSSTTSTGGLSQILDDSICWDKSSKSFTFTFKAKSSGTATVKVSNSEITLMDATRAYPSASKSIKVITQAELEASYSDNNYLSSLSVDGFELSPGFDKEILEYKVNLGASVEKINVNASVADNTASITGTGEIIVSEGDNKIDIVVTSQKGNTRTYTLIASVIDQNPITMQIDKTEYTVIKKESLVVCPELFTLSKITINDIEVPACTNELIKTNLVGLKDKSGSISFGVYDGKNISKYQSLKSNYIQFMITDGKNLDGYRLSTVKINDIGYPCYKNDYNILIYGRNLETGKENYYRYDSKEKTIQIYEFDEINELNNQLNKFQIIILSLSGLSLLLFIIIIVLIVKKKSKKSKKSKKNIEVENK